MVCHSLTGLGHLPVRDGAAAFLSYLLHMLQKQRQILLTSVQSPGNGIVCPVPPLPWATQLPWRHHVLTASRAPGFL